MQQKKNTFVCLSVLINHTRKTLWCVFGKTHQCVYGSQQKKNTFMCFYWPSCVSWRHIVYSQYFLACSANLFNVYSFIGVWCIDLTISDIRWLEAGLKWQIITTPYVNDVCLQILYKLMSNLSPAIDVELTEHAAVIISSIISENSLKNKAVFPFPLWFQY